MPNVPNVPGVPPLTSYGANAVSLIVGQAVNVLLSLFRPQWGIFKNGVPVVIAQSVVSVDFKQDWTISDYQLEEGAFESYNKVQVPFNIKLRFATGGSEVQRQQLLDSVAAIVESLDRFDVVTPEEIYQSVNVVHYDYRRAGHAGLGLILVDVWCQQVRSDAMSMFTSTKTPTASSPVNIGTVQPTPAVTSQSTIPSQVQ